LRRARSARAFAFLDAVAERFTALMMSRRTPRHPIRAGYARRWRRRNTIICVWRDLRSSPIEREQRVDSTSSATRDFQVIRVRDHELHRGWDATYNRRVQWVLNVEPIVERFGRA
jgi:hypothetical protein